MDTPPPLNPEPLVPHHSEHDRSWCIGLHLSGLAFFILPSFGNLIAPLVIWLMKKSESPQIDETGKEVLNFQISYTIYFAVSAIGWLFCIGFFASILLGAAWLILTIIAAVKTSNGENYRYPGIIRFLS